MADFSGLVEVIKQASLDAVNASKPASFVFGKVIDDDPLKIEIDDKITLEGSQLILTRNVTDYTVEMTVEHETEDEGRHDHDGSTNSCAAGGGTCTIMTDGNHNHEYKGRKEFEVHNALKVDEDVLLVQMPGGQRFIVIDRLEVGS